MKPVMWVPCSGLYMLFANALMRGETHEPELDGSGRRQDFIESAGVIDTRQLDDDTIQALALYVADNMKKRLANLFD